MPETLEYTGMQKFKKWLILSLIGFVLVFGLGLYAGYRFFAPKPKTSAPSAQAILTALHERGFLVSQTYVFDQPVTIDRSSGSAFKDFFFGQTITARGAMEVNLGVDLAKVGESDISVADGAVTVRIPQAALFNTRLVGPVEVKNDQGILKRLLDSDDGYNAALAELSKSAEAAAQQPELLSNATDQAKEDLARLLGYVAPGSKIEVVTP